MAAAAEAVVRTWAAAVAGGCAACSAVAVGRHCCSWRESSAGVLHTKRERGEGRIRKGDARVSGVSSALLETCAGTWRSLGEPYLAGRFLLLASDVGNAKAQEQ